MRLHHFEMLSSYFAFLVFRFILFDVPIMDTGPGMQIKESFPVNFQAISYHYLL